MLVGLSARVIEVGVGNGLNFAHYPPAVTGVLAVEPEPYLRDIARRNAESARIQIEVADGINLTLVLSTGIASAQVLVPRVRPMIVEFSRGKGN